MADPIFYDVESCGFHGPAVLIQWALGTSGKVNLHEVWRMPIAVTLDLIDTFMNHPDGLCGFNMAFDHFKLCQVYTTLALLGEKVGFEESPEDHIEQYALLEMEARDGPCLKPVTALDLMLHARKGPYQATMDREDIRIKRVPAVLANELAAELGQRIPLKDIYFGRKTNPKERWKVYDIEDDLGRVIPDFKNVVLKFAPTSALKALAADALNIDTDEILLFADIEIPKEYRPEELGYAPYAMSVGKPGEWNGAWPEKIGKHISHWAFHTTARKYAEDDVRYLQLLYLYFSKPSHELKYGKFKSGDDDSILSCCVGAVRWRGFKINTAKIEKLRKDALDWLGKIKSLCRDCGKFELHHTAEHKFRPSDFEVNFNSTAVVRTYLEEVLDPTTKAVIASSTKKIILEELAKWKKETVCEKCNGQNENCKYCDGTGLVDGDEPHPVAARAALILACRKAKKRVELFDKLLQSGRFHADFKVIGALSSRMAGAGGVNAQGINKEEEVRDCFDLAPEGMILLGGDFDGFEVVLIDAAYGDPELRAELMSGKKIHGLFGVFLFPGKSYEDILATKKLAEGQNLYSRSKNGVFAMAYGGEAHTLMTRVGIPEAVANEAYQRFLKRYKVFGQRRLQTFAMFQAVSQPNGFGSKPKWVDPSEYIESMFGFRRYFTVENQIVKALYQLCEHIPKEWASIDVKVIRRDKVQVAGNAVRSALLGAAFTVQGQTTRAAGNHLIQSSGATLCKTLQRRLWDIQPPGIKSWRIMPMNVHDEILAPTKPEYEQEVFRIQKEFLTEFRDKVPLLEMAFERMKTWGSKG